MNTDLEELERKAKAATPGKRHVERDTEVKADDDGIVLALCDTNTAGIKEPEADWYESAKADAQLIASLDPATVLELVRGYRERPRWVEWEPNTERYPRKESNPHESVVCVVYRRSKASGRMIRDLAYFDFLQEHWLHLCTHEPIHVTHFYEMLDAPEEQ